VLPFDEQLSAEALSIAEDVVRRADDPLTAVLLYPPLLFFLAGDGALDEFWLHWRSFERCRNALAAENDCPATRVIGALGTCALASVDPGRARPILEAALPESIELGLNFMTSRLRSFLANIEARSGDHPRAARRLLEVIEDDAAAGGWFTAWGWMHRLVPLLAAAGFVEDAIVLHHAIPPGQALIWVDDDPTEVLHGARQSLGEARFDELAEEGQHLGRSQILPWLRIRVAAIEALPAQ
jgi:hypothetical protein